MSRVLLDFGPSNVGLQPGFVVFTDLYALTTVIASPVVYEIGGGAYYFDVVFPLAASSTTTSVVYKATCNGVGRSGVVSEQPQNTNSGPLRAVFDLGLDGSGQVPQFIDFEDFDTLEALDDPEIVEIGSGLYCFEYEFPVPESPTTTEIVYVASSPVANPLSLDPDTGSTAGGDAVTITGTNFRAGATVTFGGVAATVGVITSTTIAVTTPAHSIGAVDVVVTNVDCPAATLVEAFTYEVVSDFFTQQAILPSGVDWAKIIWVEGLGLWVAVGPDHDDSSVSHLSTSPDGEEWTEQTIPTGNWTGLATDGSVVIVVGVISGDDGILRSTDGIAYSSITPPTHNGRYLDAAYDGTAFFILGSPDSATATCASSTNAGVSWTARTLDATIDATGTYFGIVGGPGAFAVAASASTGTDFMEASTNHGVGWTQKVLPLTDVNFGSGGVGMCHDGTQFVVGGTSTGSGFVVFTSSTTAAWAQRAGYPDSLSPDAFTFDGTQILGIGFDLDSSEVRYTTSADNGATWLAPAHSALLAEAGETSTAQDLGSDGAGKSIAVFLAGGPIGALSHGV